MNVYTENSEINIKAKSVVTVGTFDGLHAGHIEILNKVKDIAASERAAGFLVTFEPHPRSVVSKQYDLKLLTTLDEKKKLLAEFGIENVMIINFTEEFSRLTSEDFIRDWIVGRFNAGHMIIGHDHKFGRDRVGNEDRLRMLAEKYNFSVTAIPPQVVDGEVVSSTKIRAALGEGDIEKVNRFLGRNYSFSGTVVKGAQRGRVLGFPTANLLLDDNRKALPKRGVYVISSEIDNSSFFGIMNIGLRPTFENQENTVIEAHLFNFNRDIYGRNLGIEVLCRIRDEKKFESKEALIHQIENDKNQALEIIGKLSN